MREGTTPSPSPTSRPGRLPRLPTTRIPLKVSISVSGVCGGDVDLLDGDLQS